MRHWQLLAAAPAPDCQTQPGSAVNQDEGFTLDTRIIRLTPRLVSLHEAAQSHWGAHPDGFDPADFGEGVLLDRRSEACVSCAAAPPRAGHRFTAPSPCAHPGGRGCPMEQRKLEQRRLGSSDLRVSVVGLGCNNFGGRLDQAVTSAVVRSALDSGITFFDTADVYGHRGGSEEMLGRALGSARSGVVLASKFGHDMGEAGQGAAPAYIRRALEASLRRLGTDYLDLYQLHTPDPQTPLADTLGTLQALVGEGLVRWVGCSNLDAAGVRQAAYLAAGQGWPGFISAQDEYSLLARGAEAQLLPTLEDLDLGLLPYFPLASGLLSGKYQPGQIPPGTRYAASPRMQQTYMTLGNWQKVQALGDFVQRRGHTLLELAFSWLAAQPSVCSVIAGATTPEQVRQNVLAAHWQLDAAELTEVDRITQDEAVLTLLG